MAVCPIYQPSAVNNLQSRVTSLLSDMKSEVCNLGVICNVYLSFVTQAMKVVSSCYVLRKIGEIKSFFKLKIL